jgi:uncharacterized protein (DUF486 family)
MPITLQTILLNNHPQRIHAFCGVLHESVLKWDYLWAGSCLVGAVYFMFRSSGAI